MAIASILDALFPPCCLACGAVGEGFCMDCLHRLRILEAPRCPRCAMPVGLHAKSDPCAWCRKRRFAFDRALCREHYDDLLCELICRFKYGRDSLLGSHLGALAAEALPEDLDVDGVVPVPLHVRRHWIRGFNQAEVIACALARKGGWPMRCVLKRCRPTRHQASLSATARRHNVKAAFLAVEPEWISGKSLLLVDDVMTTGATASACARELKNAGARSVTVFVLAR